MENRLLDDLLSGDMSKIKASAFKNIPELSKQHYLDEITLKLEDLNADVNDRRRAALALGWIGSEASRAAFSSLDFTNAVHCLIMALEDKYEPFRYAAEEALINIGDQAVEPLIEEALGHEKLFVRGAAAKVLGAIGNAQAIGPLNSLLVHETSSTVRGIAENARDNIKAIQKLSKISKETRQEVAKSLEAIITEELGKKDL